MTKSELEAELGSLTNEYEEFKSKGLKLDMSRGIPGSDQLELTVGMLGILEKSEDCIIDIAGKKTDCRSYGVLDGIPEAKKLIGDLIGMPKENVIVCGNSSLNIMYNTVANAMLYGICGSTPWSKLNKVKFLCPVPGYDRHFAVTEKLGIEMINVPMKEDGPDMDTVESLVESDEAVKGIWCVPKYSNPDGTVYSDEVIKRFAALKPKAKDFRIFWDNAYVIHFLGKEAAKQANIFDEAKKLGNEDIVYVFTSTSKISFPGSGIAAVAASDRNVKDIKSNMTIQTIGYDKLNQLRHVRYFKDLDGITEHMKQHAALIRPKFSCVLDSFEKNLDGLGIAKWSKPTGGYFISLDLLDGTAKSTYDLLLDAGIKITSAGASFPYGKDPRDRNLRIAPTYPSLDELKLASDMLCTCARIACIKKLLEK